MNGTTAYVLSKQYVADTADSLGSLKGAPCTIKSQTETDDSYIVTFEWTGTSGAKETSQLTIKKPKDGTNGKNGKDGQPGKDGTNGIGISKIEKIGTVDLVDTYRITFTDNSTFDYEVKNGKDGQGGGTADVPIEKIKVNGELQTPVNKVVDITVPSIEGLTKDADLATVAKSGSYEDLSNKPIIPSLDGYVKTTEIPSKVSQLENDSNYLSSIPEEYVTDAELEAKGYLTEHQDISGKVDKVEGKSLISDTEIARLASVDNYDDTDIKAEIAKKADTTAIPSKVSELTNDSNYQTAEQVNSIVTTEIAKVVADAPEDLNTLKEMSDWIAGHEDDASAMNSAISDNKTAITTLQTGKADKSEIPTTVAELTDSADYAKTADIPTTLPANGGNSDTVNNHTVKSDVPENAVFTDTIYDDTEVKGSIEDLSSNLDGLEFGEVAGGKNLANVDNISNVFKFKVSGNRTYIVSANGANTYRVLGFKNGEHTKNILLDIDLINDCIIDPSSLDIDEIYIDFTNKVIGFLDDKLFLRYYEDKDVQYEPYIPSVKMLADKVNAQQSIEAMDLKMLGWNVPSEFPIQNEVSGNQFIQKVGRVDLGELAWSYTTNPNRFLYYLANIKSCDVMSIANVIVTDKLSVTTFDNVYSHASDNILGVSGQNIGVYASSYTDVESFKNAMKGVYLYYELATPITKTIDGNEAVEELSSNLSQLEFGEVAGGKNLLNPIWQTSSNNGIEFINNGDGSFTIKGTAVHPELSSYSKSILIPVEVGKTYKLTGNCISAYKKDNIQSILENNSTTSESTFTATEDAVNICLYVGANTDNIDITSKYMLTEATNTSEYEPYIPSVKALAEEVGKQNESLEVIGKCKNLLKPTLQTTTQYGVTCTNNGDGTYTLNGTSTAKIYFAVGTISTVINNGKTFKLTGCPVGGSTSTYYVSITDTVNPESVAMDYGTGAIKTIKKFDNKDVTYIFITIESGVTLNNVVFKPMVTTDLSATYDDFVPYTGYGDTLTHDVAKLNDNLSALGKCKNLLNPILQTTTLNGVTCTNNGDGTYTLNGTATNNATFIFANTDDTLATFKGHSSLKLVGFPKKYASAGVLQVWRQSNELIMRDKGDGVIITGSNMPYGDCNMAFIIYDGAVTDGMIIKPMVTTNLDATYDDFVPYTGDGETLASDVAEIKNDLGGLSFSASGTTLSITDGTHTWTLEANS